MNYYHSYPYGGPVPNPNDPYWRYQQANQMGANYTAVNPSTVEPPFPSGAPITPKHQLNLAKELLVLLTL